jgi:hypothetical protein
LPDDLNKLLRLERRRFNRKRNRRTDGIRFRSKYAANEQKNLSPGSAEVTPTVIASVSTGIATTRSSNRIGYLLNGNSRMRSPVRAAARLLHADLFPGGKLVP